MMCRSNLSYLFTPLLPAVAIAAAAELPSPPENTCAQVEALVATLPKPVQRVELPDHDYYYPGKTDYRRLLFLMRLWREGALPLRELPLIECVAEYTAKIGRPEAVVEPVRALLAAGAPVDGVDGNGEPLLAAVRVGNAEVCRVLTEAGARTDVKDARGRSLLYSAAVHHHAECVRLLLEKGCRPEFLSDFNTLLHAAIEDPEPEDCMCGTDGPPEEAMVEICRALLAAGADVNVKDRDGATPLLLAVGLDWERPQLVKLLLDAGADMSADKRGYTPLDIAVSCMDEEVSRMLETAGGVQSKTSPLQLAILLNRPDDVKKLLAAGADTGKSAIRVYEEITPLKCARLLGRDEIARLLSEYSAPEEQPRPEEMKRPQGGGSLLGALVGGGKVHPLQPQFDGDLWRALSDGNIAECDRLLKAGAKLQPEDPNIIDAAMHSAESVRWLMAHGATVHTFRDTMRMLGRSACNFSRATDKERFRKQVRVLLDAGIPLPEGWNLLHLSAAVGDVVLVRRMIAGGVDINARNDEGNTALLLAVMNDDPESVRLLLEAGAEADAPGAEGVTPLECSVVKYTDPHISRSLLDAGADARRRMRSGNTLLHAALSSPERVYYLLRAGADVFARDAEGRTPRERAMAEEGADELTVRLLAAFESAARGDAKREPQTPSAETTGTVARLLERALGNTEGQPEWRVRELTEMREHLCRLQAGEEQVNHYPWVIQLMTTFPSAPGWTIHRQTPFGPFTRVLRDVPTVAEDELLAALTEMVQCGASVRRTDSDGNTALYLAAQNGRESLCRRLIELGADVNRRNSRRETALHAAAQWGHAACVSALLECGADVELNDGDDCELLKAALTPVIGKNGYLTKPSVEVVRLLLEAGASVNDDELLIRAGRYGNDELVRLLARYGADVSLCDSGDKQEPQTPGAETTGTVARLLERALGDAAAQPEWRVRELTEMREHLCRLQAGEEHVNAYPWVLRILTVFPTATEQELLAAQAEMIQCGAAVNGTDSCGNTALYFAAIRSGDAVCRRLIELGAEVNSLNEWKQSALHAAAQRGHAACVAALLEAGAQPELRDAHGRTPLMAALTPMLSKEGPLNKPSVEVVRLLLDAGAPVEDAELLIHAGRDGDAELVRLLARHGADVAWRNRFDKTAPDYARPELKAVLANAPNAAGMTPLLRAAEKGDVEMCRKLIAAGAEVNAYPAEPLEPTPEAEKMLSLLKSAGIDILPPRRETALHMAARAGRGKDVPEMKGAFMILRADPPIPPEYAEVARLLLAEGADISARDEDDKTPMERAAEQGNDAALQVMMDATGYPPGMPSLHRAAAAGDVTLCRALLSRGADVMERDAQGRTAPEVVKPERAEQLRPLLLNAGLAEAVRRDHVADVQALLAAGADPEAKDEWGSTPLHYAVMKVRPEMLKMLLAAGADPEAKDGWGSTPLAIAQHMGLPDVVMALREAEASVIVADHEPEAGVEEHKILYVYTEKNGVLSTIRESVCGCGSSYSILYTYAADGRLVSARVHTETATDDTRCEYAIEDREMAPHERLTHKMFAEPRVLRARAEEARQAVMQAMQAKACMTLLRDGKLPKGALYNISFDEAAAAACEIAGHYAAVRAGQESIARYPYIAELLLLCEAQERRLPVAVLEALLAAGADVNARAEGGFGELPLDIALRMGDAPAVQRLKAAGARKTPSDCPDDEEDGAELPLPPISERSWYPLSRESVNRDFPLHAAVALGVRSECEQLLADGADVNGCNEEGRTPLHEAANVGHAQLCSLLLRRGANPFARDAQGNTPLEEAAHQGNAACCRVLYAAMQKAAESSREGLLYCRNLRTLRALLQMGMPPNATDASGHTQLHFEAFAGWANRCRVLMAAGADVNARSKQGETPLMRAVQPVDYAEDVEGTVSALLARGADVHAKDENGRTALHFAAREGRVSLCAALLMAGAEVNAPDAAGKTPLHMAVHDEAECVQLLLDAGAQVNARDEQGLTPLHELFSDDSLGKSEVCRALLAAGADVHAANEGNRTPLVEAAARGKAECCELLLAAGASVNVRDTEGRTIFSNLREDYRNYNEVIDLLVQAGADVNADDDVLWTAALNNVPEVYDRLAAAGARLTCGTPLHAAAALGRVDECRRLIEAGADVNARVGLSAQPRSLQLLQAATPLHLAARAGHGGVCRALLDAGADVNARDAWQRTPLHLARYPGVAALLLDSGADPEAADARGDRPLKTAAAAGRVPVCRLLLQRGASLDAPGYGGYTARDVAELRGWDAVVELISQYIRGTVELKATQAFIPFSYCPGMPQPSETRPEFSRPPCKPIGRPRGMVLLERVEAPSADRACAVFYREGYTLSADGMTLYVRRYSLVAPQRLAYGAMKGNVESSFRVYETVTPRTFVVEGRVLRFEQYPDGRIRSLRVASVDAADKETELYRCPESLGRVVFIGDSITHGVGAASYRWALHKILVDNGVSYEEMGVEQGNRLPDAAVEPGTSYRGVPFRNLHCAMTSERAYEIAGRMHPSSRLDGTDISDWLGLDADYTGARRLPAAPDTAFILIGTNDMLGDCDGCFEQPQHAARLRHALLDDEVGDMSAIVAALRKANPQVRVVVLSVPTWEYSELNTKPASYAALAEYNAALEAWAARAGVWYADVNEVLTDVSDTEMPGRGMRGFFYEEPGMHLHPSWQGDLLIAGAVAQALGLHGRTAATEYALPSRESLADSVRLKPADSVSVPLHGRAFDVRASVGDGDCHGWDSARGMVLELSCGGHAAHVLVSESGILWENDRPLFSGNMAHADTLRVAYVPGDSEQGIAGGFYVWYGAMLIGEALPGRDTHADDGVKITNTGRESMTVQYGDPKIAKSTN